MLNTVGPKGQVVIEKSIRDRLGVQPGWQAVQCLVNDHVELFFLPPDHRRSLRGAAKPFIRKSPPSPEEWDEALEMSIARDYREKMEG